MTLPAPRRFRRSCCRSRRCRCRRRCPGCPRACCHHRDPDVVARDGVAGRARVEDRDAVAEVEGADVAISRGRAAQDRVRRRPEADAVPTVRDGARSGRVRACPVAPDDQFAFGMALDAKPVKIEIPWFVFPEARLPAPAVTPPIVLFEPPSIAIPSTPLGTPAAPAAFVPSVVALNRVVARVQQEDAVAGVSGDHVARGGRRAADRIPGRAEDLTEFRRGSGCRLPHCRGRWRRLRPDRSRSPGRRCSTSSARCRCWRCRTPRFRRRRPCRRSGPIRPFVRPDAVEVQVSPLPARLVPAVAPDDVVVGLGEGDLDAASGREAGDEVPLAGAGPPIVLPGALSITMPIPPGAAPSAAVPAGFVPMRSPGRRCRCWRRRGSRLCEMTLSRMVLLADWRTSVVGWPISIARLNAVPVPSRRTPM